MKTDTIYKNTFVAEAPQSIEDMKASYPDKWILFKMALDHRNRGIR